MKKLLQSLLLSVPILAILFAGVAQAKKHKPCYGLLHPLDSKVASVKAQGGVWELFEKRSHYRPHSTVALHLDQKAIALIYTLDYICRSMDGIPRNDVSNYILPLWREKGEKAFIKYQTEGYGYALEEVMTWVVYAKYYEKNHQRKLDFASVQKTFDKSAIHVKRFIDLVEKAKKTNSVDEVVKEAKILIADFARLHQEDPVLKQADGENTAIPHASTLTESADEM